MEVTAAMPAADVRVVSDHKLRRITRMISASNRYSVRDKE